MTATRLKHRLEIAALRGFRQAVKRLPRGAATAFAVGAAAFTHFCLRFRVRAARRRIATVFGTRHSPETVRRIAWQSWRGLTLAAIDALREDSMRAAWLDEHTNAAAVHADISERLRDGRGAVMACAHMGAWELAAAAGRRMGLPVFAIAAPQKNPHFNAWMNEIRAAAGIDTLLRGDPDLIRKVVKRLKSGGLLAILPDVRASGAGITVPFLGGQAHIGAGMAIFARMAAVPIVPCLTFLRPGGRHEIVLHPSILPDPAINRDADIRRMTAAVMRHIEAAILDEPHQWFWYNKRWVLDPPPRAAES